MNESPLTVTNDTANHQIRAATELAKRFARVDVPLRNSFVSRNDQSSSPSLARIVRSGRGWDLRLKLYLSIVWGAVAEPYGHDLGAAAWAEVIGLDRTSGARQTRSATNWLRENSLAAVDESPGRRSYLRPLDESGSGAPYTPPYRSLQRKRGGFESLYFKIPVDLWTSGWIQSLSGRALATFLVYLQFSRSQSRDGPCWISPGLAEKRYDLSSDTRSRGLDELQSHGLAAIEFDYVLRPPYQPRRRQLVMLAPEALQDPAGAPRPSF